MDTSPLIRWAEEQSSRLLPSLGNRWLHVQGVVEAAKIVGKIFNDIDRDYLISAAYMHDIGYASSLIKTGFHPLDGASYICSYGNERLASLVAYHSGALFEANLRGLTSELRLFRRERSPLSYALTYCDMVTSPIGKRISFKSRITDINERYSYDSIVARSIHLAIPEISLMVACTQRRLDAFGIHCLGKGFRSLPIN